MIPKTPEIFQVDGRVPPPTTPERSLKNLRSFAKPAMTKAERLERIEFCVATFANHHTENDRVLAVMKKFNLKRLQARKYLGKAREKMKLAFESYQDPNIAAMDAFNFLMHIRNSAYVKPNVRLAAQKELRETFQYGKPAKLEVSANQPLFARDINLALLNNPEAVGLAMKLEELLHESHQSIMHTSENSENSEQGQMASSQAPDGSQQVSHDDSHRADQPINLQHATPPRQDSLLS